jgi:hypothetical protein
MKIYWSPSIEIGIMSIIIFWGGFFYLMKLKKVSSKSMYLKTCVMGVLAFLTYAVIHSIIIIKQQGWGADSPLMQLIYSFILFSIAYVIVINISRLIHKYYWIIGLIFTITIVGWTVNSILFNSGFPPYDTLGR